jgi:hypothetical protein
MTTSAWDYTRFLRSVIVSSRPYCWPLFSAAPALAAVVWHELCQFCSLLGVGGFMCAEHAWSVYEASNCVGQAPAIQWKFLLLPGHA